MDGMNGGVCVINSFVQALPLLPHTNINLNINTIMLAPLSRTRLGLWYARALYSSLHVDTGADWFRLSHSTQVPSERQPPHAYYGTVCLGSQTISLHTCYIATSLHRATALSGPRLEPFHRKYTARSITRDCIPLSITSSLVSIQALNIYHATLQIQPRCPGVPIALNPSRPLQS